MKKNVQILLQSAVILMTLGISAQAQPALVSEVPNGSKNFVKVGDLVFFTSGDSLLRTDGTAAGTILLKNGFNFGTFPKFNEHKGMLYFRNSGPPSPNAHQFNEIWRSDGTPSGTIRLMTSSEYNIQIAGITPSYLFFQASETGTGRELYRTDGTISGTVLLQDINAGVANGCNGFSAVAGNSLFFAANDGTNGTELWKSNGTSSGTQMVKDINPGSGNGFVNGSVFGYNNLFYFKGNTTTSGAEPWVSDGTSAGTAMLKDIVPGAGSLGFADYKIGHNGAVYFITKPPLETYGNEESRAHLWKTSGTSATTQEIEELGYDTYTFDAPFRIYQSKVYFFMRLDGGPDILMVTDGTSAGTGAVYNVQNYEGNIIFFQVVNDYMLFYGQADGSPTPFFRSDGTSPGTQIFTRFNSGAYLMYPREAEKVGDLVFYGDHDGPSDNGYPDDTDDYYQLIQSDGITTESVRDIAGGSYKGTDNITDYNGIVMFTTHDDQYNSTDKQKKLWLYDPKNPGNSAHFTLVNADTDQDIKRLNEGDVITKAENDNINIRYTPVETPGSVVFHLNDVKTRTETASPYALAGDINGNYAPWQGANPGTYKLTATPYSESGGKGTAGTPLTVNFTIQSQSGGEDCTASGTILREYWDAVSGNNVSAIPVNTPPNRTSQLNIFEGPTNSDTNFGARIRGYVCPPTTGSYTFWIASNDHSELWLSADDNPSNKVKIAYVTGATTPRQWTKFPTQKSAAINLTAGKRYYIEALHKQGVGSHNVAVGWQLPDGTLERPIPGNRLSPFYREENLPPNINITYPYDNQAFNQPANVTIQTDASDHEGDLVKVEFFEGPNKLGEVVSPPYNFTWENVPPGNYSLSAKATDGQGATDFAYVSITVNEGDGGCTASGTITREYWANVPGTSVSEIPVNSTPTSTNELTILEGPRDIGENYGTRIRGYICPPVSSGYTFWISSNDHSELWLSTDDNPANKVRLVYLERATGFREWEKYNTQVRTSFWLEAGKRYYIEVLHKQGLGTDHISVGWQLPDGTLERPIPGNRLSPFETSSARMASDDDNTTSQEKSLYSQINIYPNPVQSGDPELTIAGYERVEETVETQVEIINMTGEVVFADIVRCGGNCSTYLMNLNKQLVPGVYLVNMKTDGTRSSRRLLVK